MFPLAWWGEGHIPPPQAFSVTWLWGEGVSFPIPCNGSGWDCRGKGLHLCSEWGVVPHPLSTGAGGWQGLPRLSTQLSPVRVRSSSRYGCYGASFLLLFLAGRPGRARGGKGTAARVVGLGSNVTSWRELLLFRVGLYFLLRPRRDFLTTPGGTLRSSEWGPGGDGSLGSAPPSASSPLCCQ